MQRNRAQVQGTGKQITQNIDKKITQDNFPIHIQTMAMLRIVAKVLFSLLARERYGFARKTARCCSLASPTTKWLR